MLEYLRRRSRTVGRAPGSPLYVGEERHEPVTVEMITYDSEGARVDRPERLQECACFDEGPQVRWVNVDGLHDMEVVNRAAEVFRLHSLVVEDIVHTGQRPKMEELGDGTVFVVLKMLTWDEKARAVKDEQVSFILGRHFLLTFQERPGGDAFDEVRRRLLSKKGRILNYGADYLMYALLDAVVDQYFLVLERMGEDIEEIEEQLLRSALPRHLEQLNGLRRQALFLRKFIFPLREVVARLEKGGTELVKDSTVFFLRDLYDHTIQVMDTVETFRDLLSSMVELYLSKIGLRTNEIMKVLAMFSTLFIPLTFLAGLYGMNFEYMPELKWRYGYFGVLGVMGAVAVGMLFYFRRKGWIGRGKG
ncbi:Cobalt/magnesium transport protein CorA [Fundidesulfovibrio magnetotacticus]|uniref:Magnesium transport protein CorA n=1 Tax=Fundidesulfovibrio magnetotacticus TaxID=2730080 RepID=A0A6V8M5R6_9BACT|nr:magnesium/cobalt transporter CorA [Fundidesulfovibrio magnetotacticus]GFK95925.1 Cobalt/magnesium transport protein CorA [Fundidesulfovibrio magnetotacticus]